MGLRSCASGLGGSGAPTLLRQNRLPLMGARAADGSWATGTEATAGGADFLACIAWTCRSGRKGGAPCRSATTCKWLQKRSF